MKYMFYDEGKKKNQTYRASESDAENQDESDDKEDQPRANNQTASKSKRVDDEISKLDRLSLINMGARYELLNANKMLLDLDLGLVKLLNNS